MVQQPHYLLICDSTITSPATGDNEKMSGVGLGRWHFVLERMDGPERLEAADSESYIHQDRLALLAVVRGLEALEQSSVVRLVTTSRYVDRGLRFGLPNWRESSYQWESFGERKPVRNADLWRRIDVAMQYHKVTSRLLKSNLASTDGDASSASEILQTVFTPRENREAAVTAADAPTIQPTGAGSSSVELIGRFSPSRRILRVDGPQRLLAARHRSRTTAPAPVMVSQPARLQWWEMAEKWDCPVGTICPSPESNYQT